MADDREPESVDLYKRNAIAKACAHRHDLRSYEKEDGCEKAPSTHPDPQIATIGRLLEELSRQPLVAAFKRRPLKPYVLHPVGSTTDDKIHAGTARNYQGHILVGAQLLSQLGEAELRAVLAHEISHTLRVDSNVKRSARADFQEPIPQMAGYAVYSESPSEIVADTLAVYLTNDAESYKSALRKMADHCSQVQQATMQPEAFADYRQVLEEDLRRRFELIDGVAQFMAEPGGAKAAEASLRAEYASEHQRLYPGQFSRVIVNTRAESDTRQR